ncbi:MAG: TetR/AcrR family transcriptional regulator [Actinomycetota bacterium]|nr:TetR family transcriptional regulator [Actinomycetota bacterium]
MARRTGTRDLILERATDLFGRWGFEAVSLDQIAAEVGVAKQTVLYWFPSKDDLVQQVLARTAADLAVVVEAAIRTAPDDPLDRLEAVVKAVFRPAVRRPALLGLVREISRLPADASERFTDTLRPLVDRAVRWMEVEMRAGRLRRGDPSLVIALAYATVTGIATEPEALRVVGWNADIAGLRRLRDELVAFLRAALET